MICVVTEGISAECAYCISYLYDYVFCVEQSRVKNRNNKRREDREKLFVRFAVLDVLRKNNLRYHRIIICDSDLLPLRNFSDLCRCPAPSGILNEKKENVIGFDRKNQWIWYDVYKDIPPGASIPKEITDRVRTDVTNLGVNSVIYVFEENTIDYDEIAQDLKDAEMKPWDVNNRSFLHYCAHEDYKLWICVFLNMMGEYRCLGKSVRLKKLQRSLLELVRKDRNYVLNVREYPELKHLL